MSTRINSKHQGLNQETSNIREANPMTSTNMAGKLNRKDSRSNFSRFSAKILTGFTITALAAVSPLSAQPMLAEEPASALVREANISYDQLIDDLGEFGMAARSNVTVTQSYDQLIDDLGEFGRVAVAKTAIPSHDQLIDDLGESGRVAVANTVIPSHDQLMDDLGEFGMASRSSVTTTQSYDQLIDDLGEWGR